MKDLNKSKGFWNRDTETRQNPLLWATFWGFWGFSKEKGPQIENMETIIYSTFCILTKPDNLGLEFFFQKSIVWEITCLAKNLKSRKMGGKGQGFHFQIVVVSY
jgi:hypothetical protein